MRGILAAVAAFTLWGFTTTLFLRWIPLPGPFITCFSCLVGALTMLLRIGPARWWEARIAWSCDRQRVLAMSAAFAACGMTFHLALKKTLVANAVLTHTTYPLMTGLVLLPLLRKKLPGTAEVIALFLGIAGMTVLFWPQLSWRGSWAGEALGLSSAVFFSGYCLLMDGWRTSMPRESALVPILLLAFMILLPFGLGSYPHLPPAKALLGIVVLGVSCFAVPNALFLYAIRTVPVGRATTLGYLEPVVAILTAALLLGEPLTPNAILGGALVIASGALIVFGIKNKPAT